MKKDSWELFVELLGKFVKAVFIFYCAYKFTESWYGAVLVLYAFEAVEERR